MDDGLRGLTECKALYGILERPHLYCDHHFMTVIFDGHILSVAYCLEKEDAAIPHGSRRIIQDRD